MDAAAEIDTVATVVDLDQRGGRHLCGDASVNVPLVCATSHLSADLSTTIESVDKWSVLVKNVG
jgi:hypothetical protein